MQLPRILSLDGDEKRTKAGFPGRIPYCTAARAATRADSSEELASVLHEVCSTVIAFSHHGRLSKISSGQNNLEKEDFPALTLSFGLHFDPQLARDAFKLHMPSSMLTQNSVPEAQSGSLTAFAIGYVYSCGPDSLAVSRTLRTITIDSVRLFPSSI